MAAFQAAYEAGADGVELDVHLTADGVPVVIHNARVDATTDGRGLVNELTLDQVRRLDAGSHFGPSFRGEPVPTLEEVLATFGDRLLINIELKPQTRATGDLEGAVADLVSRYGLPERVWASSFKPYSLARLRQIAPEVPCGLLYSPLNLGTLWLVPFTPFEALHPESSLVAEWFVRLAHRVRRRVVVWTVDDPNRADQLARWGVDGIITNDPGALREALYQPR